MFIQVPAGPLVAASAMSAPAALMASKLSFPSHDGEQVPLSQDEHGRKDREQPKFLQYVPFNTAI